MLADTEHLTKETITMQAKQIEALAKALGKLQGQEDVDERTRRIVAYAVEEAIRYSSTMFDKRTNGHLDKFRELAKTNTRFNQEETAHA